MHKSVDNSNPTTQLLAHLKQLIALAETIISQDCQVHSVAYPLLDGSAGDTHYIQNSFYSLVFDRATFHVWWQGKACYLGNTLPFRFLERLARRPNQLIHCDALLDELWDRHSSRESVRSTVRVLRKKLTEANMQELANAIDGSTSHHYGLMIAKKFR
jgi:DNA-binding response OmpR family regulator